MQVFFRDDNECDTCDDRNQWNHDWLFNDVQVILQHRKCKYQRFTYDEHCVWNRNTQVRHLTFHGGKCNKHRQQANRKCSPKCNIQFGWTNVDKCRTFTACIQNYKCYSKWCCNNWKCFDNKSLAVFGQTSGLSISQFNVGAGIRKHCVMLVGYNTVIYIDSLSIIYFNFFIALSRATTYIKYIQVLI